MYTNSTWTYHMLIVGRTSSGTSSCFEAKGGIKNIGGTVTLVGGAASTNAVALASEISGLAAPVITPDTAHNTLDIKVTGVAGQTIHWVARTETAEVIY